MSSESAAPLQLTSQLIKWLTLVVGVAATYFMTIQSLRIELAAKAENRVVETLDKKMGNLEVILKEGVVSKEQFYEFSRDIENRLIRIENHLVHEAGDGDGK